MADVQDQVAVLLRVGHLEAETRSHQLAGISNLSAAFAVEGGAIQDDRDRLVMADFVEFADEVSTGHNPFDLSGALGRFVTKEGGLMERPLQRIQGATAEDRLGDLA